MSVKADKTVFELLQKTVNDKAFGAVELNKALNGYADKSETPYMTALFYGVLRKSLQFDYIIGKLCEKSPKNSIKLIIKIGLYKLRYMSMPDYAAVSGAVELCKSAGKGGASGFVNAVLKKSTGVKLPEITDVRSLAVNASMPEFVVKLLSDDYGFGFASALCTAETDRRTHIRRNGLKISADEFDAKYPFLSAKSAVSGYYVTHSDMQKLDKSDYVVQSESSVAAVKKYFRAGDKKILDLCAAPGGKSVYLYELHERKADITACDIYPHRVELIKKYAENVGAKIETALSDATKFGQSYENKFDCVICDVPCSGLGVIDKKPEILLKITPEELDELEKTQLAILGTAARYVKLGGRLCYSTCTVLRRENEILTDNFLKENDCFEPEENGTLQLFPNTDGIDGFYVKIMKRVK